MSVQELKIETVVRALELDEIDVSVARIMMDLLQNQAVICVRSTFEDSFVKLQLQNLKDELTHRNIDLIVEHLKISTFLPTIELLVLGTVSKPPIASLLDVVFDKIVKSVKQPVNVSLLHLNGQKEAHFDLPSQQSECIAFFSDK